MAKTQTNDGYPEPPSGLRPQNRAASVRALRSALESEEPLIIPGIVTALTAVQAERIGFSACYLTGAGLANFEYGLPDVGLLGMEEIASQTRRVAQAVGIPVIVDADTGFGGPISVYRTVRCLQEAGAAGIQIEDQTIPKRCGHFDGKELVTTEEMVAKIHAAVAAREAGTLLIARTDAVAVEGFASALQRSQLYGDAGADVVFVEAPRTMEEIEQVPRKLQTTHVIANVVEGGRTPEVDAAVLSSFGYSAVLYANTTMRVMASSADNALRTLRGTGSTSSLTDEMLSWSARQELVGLEAADVMEEAFAARGFRSATLREASGD